MIGAATTAIPAPRSVKKLIKEEYRTGDIVSLVQHVAKTRVSETAVFAKKFSPDIKGLRKLFNWVYQNITYKVDPAENQWVQSPGWLNKSQKGDCKSISALISTTLTNMGIDHKIRYVSYSGGEFTHVYPVAILNGQEIPMDVVWKIQNGGQFGKEKSYSRKQDFKMKGLYQLGSTGLSISGGIGTAEYLNGVIGEMETTLADIKKAAAGIPDVVQKGWGDVTRMTKGQVDRMIMADRYGIQAKGSSNPKRKRALLSAVKAMEKGSLAGIAGIEDDAIQAEVNQVLRMASRSTGKAVQPIAFTIPGIPKLPAHVDGFFKNIFNKAKKVVKQVTNAVAALFKKFTNWFFKFAAKGIGPFFIFKFLPLKKIFSPKIKQRQQAQSKSYEFIKKVGKYDDRQVQGLMLNGILENTGKTPEQLVTEAGVTAIGAVPLIPVIMKAVTVLIEVVGKLTSIFKSKEEPGIISETTMSDPTLLEEEARLRRESSFSSGSGEGSLLLPAAAAAGLLALKFI